MASTTHIYDLSPIVMDDAVQKTTVSVFFHYSTTLTESALQQQNFIYYSSETFAALSQFQTVGSLSSAKSLVSPNTCKILRKTATLKGDTNKTFPKK
jgi:hypothetical protein